MKKNLILLSMAAGLSGLAFATNGATHLNGQYTTIGFSDFSTLTADYGSEKDNLTLSQGEDYISLTLPSEHYFATRVPNGNTDIAVTVVFNAARLAQLYTLNTWVVNTISGDAHWGFGVTSEGTAKGCWGDGFWGNDANPTTGALADYADANGTITLTFSASSVGTSAIEGDSVLVAANNTLKFSASTTEVRINNGFADAIEQLYVFNTWVQSAAAASDIYAETTAITQAKLDAIPEPATATLSLLALAGLAARRRRQ